MGTSLYSGGNLPPVIGIGLMNQLKVSGDNSPLSPYVPSGRWARQLGLLKLWTLGWTSFWFWILISIKSISTSGRNWHRYAQEIGTGRESLSINSIKLENKLLLNRKIDKIVNSTKIHSFFEQSCAILSSFKIMIIFNESLTEI